MICKELGFIHNDLFFICLHFVSNFSFQNRSTGQGGAQTKPENTCLREIEGYFRLFTFQCTKEIREKIQLSSWLHDTSLLENNGLDLSDQVEGSASEHSNPILGEL